MTFLDSSYEMGYPPIHFKERKVRVTHPKTILVGPPRSGKTYLIYDYLSHFNKEQYLYLDTHDLRYDVHEVKQYLSTFIEENAINVLVIENYSFDLTLPYCDSIILSTSLPHKPLQGFTTLQLNSLGFEEFLLHNHKQQSITQHFDTFLKYGNLPDIPDTDRYQKEKHSQEILKLFSSDSTDLAIITVLFLMIDQRCSIHQILVKLKKEMKISKDRLYERCKFYEYNRLIFFIEKFNQPKATKKLYVYNPAFFNVLSYKKELKHQLTNMIFLELMVKYSPIYYLDHIEFYLPKEHRIVLSIPFFNSATLQDITPKLLETITDYTIKEITIITISTSDIFYIEDIEVTILPFYEWALLD